MLKFHYSGGRFVPAEKSVSKQPPDNRTLIHVTIKIQSKDQNRPFRPK